MNRHGGETLESRFPRQVRYDGETLNFSFPRVREGGRGKLIFQIPPCGGETCTLKGNKFPPHSRGPGGRNGRAESRARPFPSPSPGTGRTSKKEIVLHVNTKK